MESTQNAKLHRFPWHVPVESGPAGAGGGAGAAPQTPLPPPKSPSGSWGAVGLILAPSLERLWGACGGREASQMRSGDFQETTRDDPNRLLGVPLGVGPPEKGREPQGDNPGDPKEASRRRGAQVLINTKRG